MKVLSGKYNFAQVFTDDLEQSAKIQIEEMLNQPVFKNTTIRIMPDVHAGKGSVVGFTMTANDYVIPNIVGVDIGCGVMSTCLGRIAWHDSTLKIFDKDVHQNIPAGFHIRPEKYEGNKEFKDRLIHACRKLDLDYDYAARSLGTLGGGNHFIELGVDEQERTWLTVHTGSRNFGLKIAEHFQDKAKELCKTMFVETPNGLEFLPLKFGGKEYLEYLHTAQVYAQFNRRIITNALVYCLDKPVYEIVESIHNYISPKDNIIRKGAISAYTGEKVVIPFNMRDGLIIGVGKGNPKWNYSAPHGAGRIMSRSQANKTVDLEAFQKSMEGIYSTSVGKDTLDESPMVYKDKDKIIEAISETVEIQHFVKPIYNFKAGGR